MRRILYQVAMSLDGFIADSNHSADWIVHDPDIDFAEMFARFDTFLIGRRTFEFMVRHGRAAIPGKEVVVFSRTLKQRDYPDVTIVADEPEAVVRSLRQKSGKDIWLFGGGELFRALLAAGLVDGVEVAVIPVLLGEGVPMLPAFKKQTKLKLTGHHVYNKSGIVMLDYAVV